MRFNITKEMSEKFSVLCFERPRRLPKDLLQTISDLHNRFLGL
jgi:flagellar motor switch protein FliM